MSTNTVELQKSLEMARIEEEQGFLLDRENGCQVELGEYVERTVKEILATATLEQDLLDTLTLGMIRKFAVKEVDQAYHGHIMKDFVTNNPIHDMLMYAVYATFSEAMLQTHHTHERVIHMDPPVTASNSLKDAAPVPSSAEYFTVFDKLVQTYGRLFPHRLGNSPTTADKEENPQR